MSRRRLRIAITGTVQGVGFRPYVHRIATALSLDGWVANGIEGVLIEIEGHPASVEAFLGRVAQSPPPLARIVSTMVDELSPEGFATPGVSGFRVVESRQGSGASALIPIDAATCGDCLRELQDPHDRRFGHPFINCTNCGPRYTIIQHVPYDRSTTTMATFTMCPACAAEYSDPNDRRFHAEPICCPACGPRLRFIVGSADEGGVEPVAVDRSIERDVDALAATVDALRAGRIVAVKGTGGYHLAADASDQAAVDRLRALKNRDEKPFALMVADVVAAARIVELTSAEETLLLSVEAPIVLARRRPGFAKGVEEEAIAKGVAPGNERFGVMLPSNAMQHLLARAFDGPLIMTSGNRSDEPVAFADVDALEQLRGIADAFLVHDRPIHRRADDSVVRCTDRGPTLLRRARGFSPSVISLHGSSTARSVLGVGAELKSTVCLTRGGEAVVSPHLGDLEHVEVHRSFTDAIGDLEALLGVQPELIVHDLHPEYLSTKWAQGQDVELLGVQHHHAHIASCLAEHGLDGSVVGLAFDGHGFGPDGTLWGGECLVADLRGFTRFGHLREVALPGGSTAIRDPWRMAVAYLQRAYQGDVPQGVGVYRRNSASWGDVATLAAHPMTLRTTSVGRLFDAIAAILGICDRVTFEGQAAIALEQAAWRARRRTESLKGFEPIELIVHGEHMQLDPSAFIRWLSDPKRSGISAQSAESFEPAESLALCAHQAIADASVALATAACGATALATVALSGGVFQNALLMELVRTGLEERGLRVLSQSAVPANDGGISLGQVAIGRAARQEDPRA